MESHWRLAARHPALAPRRSACKSFEALRGRPLAQDTAHGLSRLARAEDAIAVSARRSWACLVAMTVMVSLGSPAWAQSAAEPVLKAAFIYNFAKFAEWPADAAPADPLT